MGTRKDGGPHRSEGDVGCRTAAARQAGMAAGGGAEPGVVRPALALKKPAAFPEVTRRGTPQVHGPGPPGRSGASSRIRGLGRVGAAHTATTLGSALVLVERSEEHTSELQSRFDLVC